MKLLFAILLLLLLGCKDDTSNKKQEYTNTDEVQLAINEVQIEESNEPVINEVKIKEKPEVAINEVKPEDSNEFAIKQAQLDQSNEFVIKDIIQTMLYREQFDLVGEYVLGLNWHEMNEGTIYSYIKQIKPYSKVIVLYSDILAKASEAIYELENS